MERRLGPYRLLERVGAGAMGEVWRAVEHPGGLTVAVKVMASEAAREERFRAALRNEVRALAALEHPHVVQIHDAGETSDGSPWLAMEWVSGGTLADLPLPVPWPVLRPILAALLDALAHLHARGLVHRDVKPANVLRGAAGDLRPGWKLGDFGIAASGESTRGDVAGTPAYMAPEQRSGRARDLGPWTDLFALGCVAWELTSGDLPPGASLDEAPFLPRVPVPAGLEAWLRRMVATSPTDRHALAADAAAVLAGMGTAVDGPTGALAPRSSSRGGTTFAFGDAIDGLDIEPPRGGPLAPPASWQGTAGAAGLRHGSLALWGLRTVPLVGREDTRDRLWSALLRVFDEGGPGAVVLSGPGGIGKSRLAEWLCLRAQEVGVARWVRAVHAAVPGTGDGLIPMVAAPLGLGTGDTRGFPAVDLPEAARRALRMLHAATESAPATPPAARLALVRRALAALARERPLVVWLDDVQWGHEAVRLVREVLDAGTTLPVLFVLTVSDEDLDAEVAADLSRLEGRVERLALAPLSLPEMRALVHGMVGLDSGPAARLVELAAGSPRIIVEIVDDWVRRGLLTPSNDGLTLRDGVVAELPTDLVAAWRARMEDVLAEAGAGGDVALELAAVLGVEVDGTDWRRACTAAGRAAPPGAADRLVAARLATTGPEGTEHSWAFAHATVREVLLDRARRGGRLRAHHAACVEALVPRTDATARGRHARHLLGAGRAEEAFEGMVEAAGRLERLGDLTQARALVGDIESLLAEGVVPVGDPRRIEATLVRVNVTSLLGQMEHGRDLLEGLLATMPADAPRALVHRARQDLAHACTNMGDTARALVLLEQEVEETRAEADGGYLARAISYLGPLLAQLGRLEEAERWLASIEGSCPTALEAYVLQWRGSVLRRLGRLAEATEVLVRAREAYLQTRNGWGGGAVENALGDLARSRGDGPAAEAHYTEAIRQWGALGVTDIDVARLNLALVRIEGGDPLAAEADLADIALAFERRGRRPMLAATLVLRLPAAAARADWPAFRALAERAAALLEETGFVDHDIERVAARAAAMALDPACAALATGIADRQRARLC